MDKVALAFIAVIVVLLYYSSMREEYTADILKSNYPRLIYNVPPFLPTGSTVGLNYRNPMPTQWPPYLVQGQYSAPHDPIVVAPIEWKVNP